MIAIFIKEFNSYLNGLIAYIVIAVFLTTIGLLMWVFPESSILDYGYAELNTLFNTGPFVFMFLVPAITMRFFSEEKRTGTAELLYTKPVKSIHVILGKFLAGWSLVSLALLPTLLYFYSVYQLGNPVGNMDISGSVGSYIGLLLVGASFVAIGVFTSSLTENQVVAFVLSVFLCFLLYSGLNSVAAIDTWGGLSLILEKSSMIFHYNSLSRGLIDLEDVSYFLSVSAFFILLTQIIISSRKWQ